MTIQSTEDIDQRKVALSRARSDESTYEPDGSHRVPDTAAILERAKRYLDFLQGKDAAAPSDDDA